MFKTVKKVKNLFQARCSQCHKPVPKGSPLNKYVKMANGSWKKVCQSCYKSMGRPGQLTNIRRGPAGPKTRSGAGRYGDPNPNQGTLW